MKNFKLLHKWLTVSLMVIFAIFTMAALIGYYFFDKNIEPVRASSADNVTGFAWSSNIGYISFNASNCDTDGDGFSDQPLSGCPATGVAMVDYGVKIDKTNGDFSGYAWSPTVGWISFNRADTGNPPSNDPGAGVGKIAELNLSSGAITGWAKVFSLGDNGWIRFDHNQVGNEAVIDIGTGNASGWAWNEGTDEMGIGWISLNSGNPTAGPGGGTYIVHADLNLPPSITSVEVFVDGNDVTPPPAFVAVVGKSLSFDVDWIDSNIGDQIKLWVCDADDADGDSVIFDTAAMSCDDGEWAHDGPDANGPTTAGNSVATIVAPPGVASGDAGSNTYQVWICDQAGACTSEVIANFTVNTPPEAKDLTAPNWNYSQACDDTNGTNAELRAHLQWTYSDADDDNSLAYQITVKDNGGTQLFTTNKCTVAGGVCQNTCIGVVSGTTNCVYELDPNSLVWFDWDTAYRWEVTVWDSHNTASVVTAYNSSADTDNEDHNPITFTTYKHKFPDPAFSWFTPDPSATEEVLFTDKSYYYKNDNTQSLAGVCGAGFGPCSWTWTKTDSSADIDIDSPFSQETIIKFNNTTDSSQINLKACDKDSYCCNIDDGPAGVKEKLPGWKEGAN